MGRKIQFDKDHALTLAMKSFWTHGYSSTSMRSLADKLGIHLGSVYNALGDKEVVFEKSLRLHYDTYVLPALAELAAAANPLRALDGFMEKVVNECCGVEDTPGCFLVNSLLQITALNDSLTATAHEYIGKVEEGLKACLARAVELGHLPVDTDLSQKARGLIAALFSMRVMGKLKMPHPFIRDIKTGAVEALSA